MESITQSVDIFKYFISGAIFFVWFIRYSNIVAEFKHFQYPDWLRDFVGVLKISFAIMILQDQRAFIIVGCSGIAILMLAAFFTHLKVKNSFQQMLPSLTLMILSLLVLQGNM